MCSNPYEVLGLLEDDDDSDPGSISFDDCKGAYQKLCLKYHPDKNIGGDSSSKFLEVQGAWELIGSVEKKSNYDKKIAFTHTDITRSDESYLSDFSKERVIVVDECDGTETEGWAYRKECRCGDFYEFMESDIDLGFNTTQCSGCSLYVTITEV